MLQAAFLTLPERMQAVQTRICFLAPLTTAFTRRRLGFQRRRVTLCAWLIVFPKDGFLPHISQTSAIVLIAPDLKSLKDVIFMLPEKDSRGKRIGRKNHRKCLDTRWARPASG
jgi:hypothetical protein